MDTEISFCLETMKHKHQATETLCIFLRLQTIMSPLLQKGKQKNNRKTQASDFKKTWELWVPECCNHTQGAQKQKNSLEVETSENISPGNSVETSRGQH